NRGDCRRRGGAGMSRSATALAGACNSGVETAGSTSRSGGGSRKSVVVSGTGSLTCSGCRAVLGIGISRSAGAAASTSSSGTLTAGCTRKEGSGSPGFDVSGAADSSTTAAASLAGAGRVAGSGPAAGALAGSAASALPPPTCCGVPSPMNSTWTTCSSPRRVAVEGTWPVSSNQSIAKNNNTCHTRENPPANMRSGRSSGSAGSHCWRHSAANARHGPGSPAAGRGGTGGRRASSATIASACAAARGGGVCWNQSSHPAGSPSRPRVRYACKRMRRGNACRYASAVGINDAPDQSGALVAGVVRRCAGVMVGRVAHRGDPGDLLQQGFLDALLQGDIGHATAMAAAAEAEHHHPVRGDLLQAHHAAVRGQLGIDLVLDHVAHALDQRGRLRRCTALDAGGADLQLAARCAGLVVDLRAIQVARA